MVLAHRWLRSLELGVLVLGLLLTLALHNSSFYPVDDAYISFRYSANWARGDGLTFNPGERLEGYSNFLPVAWGAALLHLGVSPPLAARLSSLGAMTALLAIVVLWRRRPGDTVARLCCGCLLGAGWHTIVNVHSGMEAPLFAALLAGVAISLGADRLHLASVLGLLLALTRPEGVAAAGGLLGVYSLALYHRRRRTALRAILIGPGLLFALPYAGYTAWRVWYFGELLPNSVVAKMGVPLRESLAASWAYTSSVAGLYYPALLVLLAAGWAAGRPALYRFAYVWLGLCGIVAFSLVAGSGDPYVTHGRYLYPAIVLFWLLCSGLLSAARLSTLGSGSFWRWLWTVGALLLFAWQLKILSDPAVRYLKVEGPEIPVKERIETGLRSFISNDREPHVNDLKPFFFGHFEMASWLREHSWDDALLVTDAAGIAPYYNPGLRVYDTYGLLNRRVARAPGRPGAKGSVDWVYEANPDFIAFKKRVPRLMSRSRRRSRAVVAGGTPIMLKLFRDRRLRTHYDFVRFFGNRQGRYLLFQRRPEPLEDVVVDLFQEIDVTSPMCVDSESGEKATDGLPAGTLRRRSAVQFFGPHQEDAFFHQMRAPLMGRGEDYAVTEVMREWLSRRRDLIVLNPIRCACQPCGADLELSVPEQAVLLFGFRTRGLRKPCIGRVRYEVRIAEIAAGEGGGASPGEIRWQSDLHSEDVELDLSAFGGRHVRLSFLGTGSAAADQKHCPGWWADPRIVIRSAATGPPPEPVRFAPRPAGSTLAARRAGSDRDVGALAPATRPGLLREGFESGDASPWARVRP